MRIIDIWIIEVLLFNGSSINRLSTLYITHTKCRMLQLMYYSYMNGWSWCIEFYLELKL